MQSLSMDFASLICTMQSLSSQFVLRNVYVVSLSLLYYMITMNRVSRPVSRVFL